MRVLNIRAGESELIGEQSTGKRYWVSASINSRYEMTHSSEKKKDYGK